MKKFLTFAPSLFSALSAFGAAWCLFSYFGNGALSWATPAFVLVLLGSVLLQKIGKQKQVPLLAISFIVLLAVFLLVGWDGVMAGAGELSKTLSQPYDMDLSLPETLEPGSPAPFKLWLLLFLSWFFLAGTISTAARAAAFLLSLFLLLAGFYFGMNPPSGAVVLMAAYGLTLPVRFTSRGRGQAEVPVYLLSLVLGGLIMLLIPGSSYMQPGPLSKMQENILSWTDPYDPIFHAGNAYAGLMRGTAGHEKLGSVDSIHYTGRIIADMETADISKRLYLRSWVGGVYEGNQWRDLPEKDYEGTQRLFEKNQGEWYDQGAWLMEVLARNPALMQQLTNYMDARTDLTRMKQDFSITAVYERTKDLFLPYDADFGAPLFLYDRSPVTDGGKAYTTDLWNLPAGPLLSMMTRETISDPYYVTYVEGERRYRDFVYAHYLTVPDDVQAALARLGNFTPVQSLSEKRQRVQEIHDFLTTRYTYTRNPGRTPAGKDFITYFLLENPKGYCTHFASAAVMMLRASGIPARYATGLSVGADEVNGAPLSPRGGHRLAISDHHAHAWVEVYVDGLGWRPTEMTPGVTGGENPFPIPPDKQRNDTGAENKPPEPQDRDGEKQKDQPEKQPPQQKQQQRPAAQPPALNQPQMQQTAAPSGSFPLPLLALCILLGAAAGVLFYRATYAGKLIAHGADDKESWNRLLAYMDQLTQACSISTKGSYEKRKQAYAADKYLAPFAGLLTLLVQARFSGTPLTKEQKQNAMAIIAEARKRYFDDIGTWKAFVTKVKYKL